MLRYEAVVSGRVQGVGFRHFTRRSALSLGLVGFVRNQPDGTVSVVAIGPRAKLILLAKAIAIGPSRAYVEHVDETWSEAHDTFSSFKAL